MLDSTKGQTLHKQKPRLLEVVHQVIRRPQYSRTEKSKEGATGQFEHWSQIPNGVESTQVPERLT